MSDRASGEQPFDERAALEELARVRKEIERYQAQRKTLEEEFDRFTASFRQPIPVTAPTAPPPIVAPPTVAPASVSRPTVPPPTVPHPTVPPAAFDPSALDEPPVRPQDENPVSAPLSPAPVPVSGFHWPVLRFTPSMIAGALLLVAGVSYVLWMQTRPAVRPAATVAQGPKAAAAPATKTAAAPQPKGGTAAPPAQPARHESVVTTTRAVWVRIIADGVPVVERELPANTRLPFVARERIVIRTGNAGAVRLTIGGIDRGALGDFGEVVTRRFDVPR